MRNKSAENQNIMQPIKFLSGLIPLWCAATAAHAVLVADWGFDSLGTSLPVNTTISPETGTRISSSVLTITAATASRVAGTTVNDRWGSFSDTYGLQLDETGQFRITINRTDLQGMALSYAVQKNQGSPSLTWYWSTDTVNWNTLSSLSVGSGWVGYTNTIPASAEGSGNLYFRAEVGGTGNRSVQFDNVFITALTVVPEPTTWALIGFGALLALTKFTRFLVCRSRMQRLAAVAHAGETAGTRGSNETRTCQSQWTGATAA